MPGFLGTPAPFMMDVVVVSLIAVVPFLVYSILQAKKGNYIVHKNCQYILAIVLGIAVLLFELEMRLAGGIKNIIEPGRYTSNFRLYLWFHIALAVSTLVLWVITLSKAKTNFDGKAMAPEHRATHRKLGISSTLFLVLTSLTGLGVYAWSFL